MNMAKGEPSSIANLLLKSFLSQKEFLGKSEDLEEIFRSMSVEFGILMAKA